MNPNSQNWYFLAFGVELGPMSWDDLVERAARGDLRPNSQVRNAEQGAFAPAADVPGLFTPNLKTASPQPVSAEKPAAKSPPPVHYAQAPAPPMPRAPSPAAAAPVATTSAPSAVAAPKAPPPKPAKIEERRRPSRPPIKIRIPGRFVAAVMGAAMVAAAGYGGWAYVKSMSSAPDFKQMATVYRQTYDEIKHFRGAKPAARSLIGMQFQFSRRVNALRKQLQNLPDEPSAGKLVEAGSELSQMLADCQAAGDSTAESRFAEHEQRFLAILDNFQ